MPYMAMLILLLLGIGGAIAALVVGIVMLAQRRWRGGLIALALLLLSGLLSAAAGVGMVVKVSMDVKAAFKRAMEAEKARELAAAAHSRKSAEAVESLTPGVDWTTVDPKFWTDSGFRDWFRVPIRWPYEVVSVDEIARGMVHRNTSAGKSGPTDAIQGTQDMIAYACDGTCILFHQQNKHDEKWGWMEFDTEIVRSFDTEADMWRWANTQGWKGPATLKSVKDNYEDYWSP